jgi:transposase
MKALLEIINRATYQAEGMLSGEQQQRYRRYYHRLLSQADREYPGPASKDNNKRGRVKRSKARNLLERLINNQGERDIRMTKVHQKISGCFRSAEGADTFC